MDVTLLALGILFHLGIYGIPPVMGIFLSKDHQIQLNYAYLGVVFSLVQLFDNLYEIPIAEGFSLNGGDIAYSALLFATVYLLVSNPKPEVVRNLVYLISTLSIFLFLLFGIIRWLVHIGLGVYYIDVPDVIIEYSVLSLLFTLSLYSVEIILILLVIKCVRRVTDSPKLLVLGMAIGLWVVLVIDGIVYPIGFNLLFPSPHLSIRNSVYAKLIFGSGFSILLTFLLLVHPQEIQSFLENKFSIVEYFLPPRYHKMQEKLEEAEAELSILREFLPICSSCKKIRDDEGYWQQLEEYMHKYKHLDFTHSLCPECMKEFTKDIIFPNES